LTSSFLLQPIAYGGGEKSCLKLLHHSGEAQIQRSSSILPWTSLHPRSWRSTARADSTLSHSSESDQQTRLWYGTEAPHLPLPKRIKTPSFTSPDCAPAFGKRCFSRGAWLGNPWFVLARTDVGHQHRASCSRSASHGA